MQNANRATNLAEIGEPMVAYFVPDNHRVYLMEEGTPVRHAFIVAGLGLTQVEAMGQTVQEIREYCVCFHHASFN
jgi:hypothetical protein